MFTTSERHCTLSLKSKPQREVESHVKRQMIGAHTAGNLADAERSVHFRAMHFNGCR